MTALTSIPGMAFAASTVAGRSVVPALSFFKIIVIILCVAIHVFLTGPCPPPPDWP
jgi:hypothetical protein